MLARRAARALVTLVGLVALVALTASACTLPEIVVRPDVASLPDAADVTSDIVRDVDDARALDADAQPDAPRDAGDGCVDESCRPPPGDLCTDPIVIFTDPPLPAPDAGDAATPDATPPDAPAFDAAPADVPASPPDALDAPRADAPFADAPDAESGAIDPMAPRDVIVHVDTRRATPSLPAPCAGAGRDVFLRFTLARRSLVYADTRDASWDTVLFFASGCDRALTMGTTGGDTLCDAHIRCPRGAHGSQVVALLPAGTHYLVVSGAGGAAGEVDVHVQRAPVSAGAVEALALASGTTMGWTLALGTANSTGQCEAPLGGNTNAHWWTSCPGDPERAFTAEVCPRDSILTGVGLFFRAGDALENCARSAMNPPECPFLGWTLNDISRAGPHLHVLYVATYYPSLASRYDMRLTVR